MQMVSQRLRPDFRWQTGTGGSYLQIGRALEGHDDVGDLVEMLPAPGVELRIQSGRVLAESDFGLVAFEQEGKPFLPLAPIPATQGAAQNLVGQIVTDPVRGLREEANGADAGFLVELAIGGP